MFPNCRHIHDIPYLIAIVLFFTYVQFFKIFIVKMCTALMLTFGTGQDQM